MMSGRPFCLPDTECQDIFVPDVKCQGMWGLVDVRHSICLWDDEPHCISLLVRECQGVFLPDDECLAIGI